MTDELFADALKQLMQDRKLSYRALAAMTAQAKGPGAHALTHSFLSQLGRKRVPVTVETIEAVSAALDLDPTYFLEYRLALIRRLFDERRLGAGTAEHLAELMRLVQQDPDSPLYGPLEAMIREYERSGGNVADLIRPHVR